MSTVHVVPLADPIAHVVPGGYGPHDHQHRGWLTIVQLGEDEDCPCGPAAEYVPGEDGDGWIVIHRAIAG